MLDVCGGGVAFLLKHVTVFDKNRCWAETWAWFAHRHCVASRMSNRCSVLGEWPVPRWLWVNGANWGTENSSRCLVLKSRSCFLPINFLWIQWFPIPSFGFWLCCQTGLYPDSGCCDWFHCFAFYKPNPNPTGSVFIGGFSPRQGNFVVHTFTSKAAAICELPGQKGLVCTCVCVCAVSVLISSIHYHSQWVKATLKDNLPAYSAPWSALRWLHLSFKWHSLQSLGAHLLDTGGLEIEVKLESYRSSSWRLKDRDYAARGSGIVGSVARICQISQ